MVKLRLCLFFTALVAKFWLIWESEVVDAVDDPHEYVLQILYPVNGGLAFPPGTGLVGHLFNALDIPFRLGIEIVFIAATIFVVRALLAWPWERPLALGVFIFVVLDPTLFDLFSRLGSDEVWLVETMLGAACFALAWRDEAPPHRLLLGLAALLLGLSVITRSTIAPLLLALIVFTAGSAILIRAKRQHPNAARALAELVLGIWTLALGLLVVYGGTCALNARIHGYSGISVIDSAEYKKFYVTLESVGDADGVKYFAIDQDRRNLIARAGPTSKWLMNEIDHNDYYRKIGLSRYGRYDIPSGWFEFAVFNAALPVSQGDFRQCFVLFTTVEREIAEAGRRGIIPIQTNLPLPDRRLNLVLPEYPHSLLRTLGRILDLPPPGAFDSIAKKGPYLNDDFSKALLRRNVQPSPVRDAIWRILDTLYSFAYTQVALLFFLALVAFGKILVLLQWRRFESFSLPSLARQFFLVLFIVFILWYALFDASGRPIVTRYMIFNHVMLPILIGYYLIVVARLVRRNTFWPHALVP